MAPTPATRGGVLAIVLLALAVSLSSVAGAAGPALETGPATPAIDAGTQSTGDLELTVLDPDGDALSDADVVVRNDEGTLVETVETDDAGGATIGDVPSGTHELTVSAQGYADGETTVTVEDGEAVETTVTLEARDDGTLSGTVYDADGDALAAGTFVTFSAEDPAFGPDKTLQVGADGSYELDGIEPGTYDVTADALAFEASDPVTAEVDEAGATGVDFVLGGGEGAIEGTVRDADGDPLAEEAVLVRDRDADLRALVETDSSGTFSLEGVPAGAYDLAIGANGQGTATASVTVTDAETATLTVELPGVDDAGLAGTVTDADGDALAAGTFVTFSADDPAFGPDKTLQVGADGSYELLGIDPGTYDVTVETLVDGSSDAKTVTVDDDAITSADFTFADGGDEDATEDEDGDDSDGDGGADSTQPPEGSVVVTDLSVSELPIAVNEPVTIAVELENEGDADAEYAVELALDGTTIEERTVAVDAGSAEPIETEYTFEEPGEYELSIDDVSTTVSVQGDDEGGDDGDEGGDENGDDGDSDDGDDEDGDDDQRTATTVATETTAMTARIPMEETIPTTERIATTARVTAEMTATATTGRTTTATAMTTTTEPPDSDRRSRWSRSARCSSA